MMQWHLYSLICCPDLYLCMAEAACIILILCLSKAICVNCCLLCTCRERTFGINFSMPAYKICVPCRVFQRVSTKDLYRGLLTCPQHSILLRMAAGDLCAVADYSVAMMMFESYNHTVTIPTWLGCVVAAMALLSVRCIRSSACQCVACLEKSTCPST